MNSELRRELTELGYDNLRVLPEVGICGTYRFMYTGAIVCGLGRLGYSHRYCYQTMADARLALEEWDGSDHPGGDWIKCKGLPGGDLSNPNLPDEEF